MSPRCRANKLPSQRPYPAGGGSSKAARIRRSCSSRYCLGLPLRDASRRPDKPSCAKRPRHLLTVAGACPVAPPPPCCSALRQWPGSLPPETPCAAQSLPRLANLLRSPAARPSISLPPLSSRQVIIFANLRGTSAHFYRGTRQHRINRPPVTWAALRASGKGFAPPRPYTELDVQADRITIAHTTELAGAGVPTCRAGARTRREAAFRNPDNARPWQDASEVEPVAAD